MDNNIDSEELITKDEMEGYQKRLLKSVSVVDWVKHGLQLPQYALSFEHNAIAWDDFILIIRDSDQILEDDLKIFSKLHKRKIIKGMKSLVLGLGDLPSAPEVTIKLYYNSIYYIT